MIKNIKTVIAVFLSGAALIFFILINNKFTNAATNNVAISTTVQASLSMDITAGDTVAFGPLTAGVPITAPNTGTIVAVTTNASNGYTLGISDGAAGSGSALLHTDTTTRISDVTNGTIATPASWGASTGLGVTLFVADTNKEAKWGAGMTYNDVNNKYAAIPQTDTPVHAVTGLVVGADTSSWAFKLDVPTDQKTGSYTGNMIFTATAVLS